MMGYVSLLLWVAILSVAVGLYDITLVKVKRSSSSSSSTAMSHYHLMSGLSQKQCSCGAPLLTDPEAP